VTATAVGAPGHHPAYDWITPTEAATRLRIPVREVYRLIDRGEVPGYRLAEEIRLLAHEVDELARRRPPR
jgi:excisionase family DNA binding protein